MDFKRQTERRLVLLADDYIVGIRQKTKLAAKNCRCKV